MPADLDLVVHASEIDERRIADRTSYAVTRAVVGLLAARRHHEGDGCLLGVAPVAGRHLGAGHEQLSVGSRVDLHELLVRDERRQAGVGRSDRDEPELRLRGRALGSQR